MLLNQTQTDQLQMSVSKIEGAVEGIAIFHPGVGKYMRERLDEIYRIISPRELKDWSKTTLKSKEGFKEIDKEAMSDPVTQDPDMSKARILGKVQDRKIMENVSEES